MKKLIEPKEVCPFCGRHFRKSDNPKNFWVCTQYISSHGYAGPDDDTYGRKIDKQIRQMRKMARRVTK
jgi:ssDNA-binding Zn-finger/Zn-ribbon topoisomerase 1